MMPLGLMRPQIEKRLSALRQYSLHAGQKLDRVARAIARERDLPKFRVRARLIQMGYIAAKGALNFVDGAYTSRLLITPAPCRIRKSCSPCRGRWMHCQAPFMMR